MTRASWVRIGVILAVALAVSTVAFADQTYYTPGKPGVGLRQIYNRSTFFGNEAGTPVQLPRPVGDSPTLALAVSGPIASSDAQTLDVTNAIAAVRGGGSSMYSQKQQADQEIGRLIRRLD